MKKSQITTAVKNVESIRDTVLGSFIVQTLKAEDPDEYESLMAYFMKVPCFVEALTQANDQLFSDQGEA